MEENISGETVNILAPSDGSVLKNSSVSFRWDAVVGASKYKIQVARPNFNNPQQFLINEEVEELEMIEELGVGEYEWRVQALNSGYYTPFTTVSFKITENEDFSSTEVTLLSPDDDVITNEVDQTLKWRSIEGASLYRILLESDGEVIDEKVSSESEVNVIFPQGELIWKVRAENSTQNTLYSKREILVDTIRPNTPKLIKPTDEASLDNASVEFEWQRDNIKGADERDSLFVFKDLELENLEVKAEVINSYNALLDRDETYYWFMISYDDAGNQSDMSEVYSFLTN